MPQASSIAVVLQRGLVETIIVEGWPNSIPLPRIVVVDYSVELADDDEVTEFTIGSDNHAAVCHEIAPSVYELQDVALSPKQLLTLVHEGSAPAVPLRFVVPVRASSDAGPVTQSNRKAAQLPADQSRFLAERLRTAVAKQPGLAELRRVLLGIGGVQLVAPPGDTDADLPSLLAEGRVMSGLITFIEMQPSGCHANVAKLWRHQLTGMIGICSGYALSDDGLWRQHSWGLTRDGIVETTVLREAYFGLSYSPEMSERLAAAILT